MEFDNVYKLLNNKEYDPYAIRNKNFILLPHQVIPKYYLLSNPNVSKLILSYSMGSGKSAAATFALLYNLNIYRMYKFNVQYAPVNSRFLEESAITQNVIVVGAWQTQSQIEVELMRPEFGIVSQEKINEIKELMSSTLEEKRKEGEEKKQKIIKTLDKDIKFQGYQAFFNLVFPGIQSEKYGQNIDALIQEYNRGSLKVSDEFLSKYQSSIIIIDEMQRLYSNGGLNTYGFAVAAVSKLAKQYGIKMLFLTGTMLNSSLGEMPDILNIISDEKTFHTKDELCEQEIILDDVPVWRLRKSQIEKCINLFKNNFMYYNQSARLRNEIPEFMSVSKFPKSTFIPEDLINRKMEAIVFPQKRLLPREIHIGNKLLNTMESLQPMILYSVEVEGLQALKYEEYVNNNVSSSSINEMESETVTHIHDAYIPPKNEWNKYSIYEESNNILWGKFLDLKNLRNFSALGYELCVLCINNGFNNEKTVVYHNKLNSFGIKQYGAILQYNGFIKYGDVPNERSLCKACHNTYKMHSLPLEDRIKNKVCNKFSGLYYDMLTGDLSQSERDGLTNNIYNNPNNLYGDIIDVMFVSDVAYSGVSFFNTQNLVVLSRIPNLSKWKQIYARIIRTRSHALLPDDKQYAKIYTFVVELPNERKKFPQLKDFTLGQRYYKIREILNEDIEKFTSLLSENCISKTLLEHPEKYKQSETENKISLELFNSDLQNEISLIVNRIMVDKNTMVWIKDTFMKRLMDQSLSVTYLDISAVPENILMNLLVKDRIVTLFQYERNDDKTYVKLTNKDNKSNVADNLSTFQFSQLQNVNLKRSNVNNLLRLLESEKSYSNKLILLSKILKLVNKKYNLLVDKKIFWDTMYEIGNEYYPDDETNFIRNHCKKNRNVSMFTGCYYGQEIILMDGSSKIINYSFPIVEGLKDLPFLFKITCLSLSESSPFYIHVNVMKISDADPNKDQRKINKGLVCTSMNVTKLHKYFPSIDPKLHKKNYCNELLFILCEMQSKTEKKFVYTPFEK